MPAVLDQLAPAEAPLTEWDPAALNLEGYAPAEAALGSFGKVAVELGLTASQAERLTKWQLEFVAANRKAAADAAVDDLRKEWGNNAGRHKRAIENLMGRVDRALGSTAFSDAINQSDASCSAGFMRGLLALAQMTAEDSLQGRGGGTGAPRQQTVKEGIIEAFNRARGIAGA